MSAPARGDPAAAHLPDGSIEIVPVETSADLRDALEIRRRVFSLEQGVADLRVADPDDARSLIALARMRRERDGHVETRPVATGRLTPSPLAGGPALVAWVATLPEFRGQGIGHALMRYLLDAADHAGIREVTLAAQAPAERFYRRLGFTTAGPHYDVRGIPHVRMVRHRLF